MSKKSLVLLVVAALTLSLAFAVSMSVASEDEGVIILNPDGKKPASFPHKEHQEKNDCSTCHHTSKDGVKTPLAKEEITKEAADCASCHNDSFANEKLRSWKDIGHGLCKDCHTKMKDDGAPTKCNDCHIKKD